MILKTEFKRSNSSRWTHPIVVAPPRGVRLTDLPKWKAELAGAAPADRPAINRKWGAA